jgi:hypothetical protein
MKKMMMMKMKMKIVMVHGICRSMVREGLLDRREALISCIRCDDIEASAVF